MTKNLKNILYGAATLLDLEGRDSTSPIEFNTETYTYPGSISASWRKDAVNIRSDIKKAYRKVSGTLNVKGNATARVAHAKKP